MKNILLAGPALVAFLILATVLPLGFYRSFTSDNPLSRPCTKEAEKVHTIQCPIKHYNDWLPCQTQAAIICESYTKFKIVTIDEKAFTFKCLPFLIDNN